MKGRVLVAGFATRHVARSAHDAGYEVFAVDHFCDQDLSWYTRDRIGFEELCDLPGAIEEMCRRYRIDYLVPASGAEHLKSPVPLLGCPPERAERFLDKLVAQEFFEELGVPVPRLLPPGHYPAMLKPRTGSGGWRNRVVVNEEEREEWEEIFEHAPHIAQEVVNGIPASVCCVASDGRARAIAVNRQILRGAKGAHYGFCGSVTPFEDPRSKLMTGLAEKIAGQSLCRGTVGIDFVIGAEPWAIEVNPRFQATVDTIEMATGMNLFSLHARACEGFLPECTPAVTGYAVRSIVFAERDMVVEKNLAGLAPAVADIPWPGTFFEEGHAVISVYGWGPTEGEAMSMLDKHIMRVGQYMG